MLNQETLEAIQGNTNFEDKELLKELAVLFNDRPEAVHFLKLYGDYCEIMDDIVDEEKVLLNIDRAGQLRMEISGTPYFQKHQYILWIVERLIHSTYFDSAKWEHATEEWKRRDAKCLSHCAYNMLFAVIIIEFGYDKLRELSLRFREHAHSRHLHDTI